MMMSKSPRMTSPMRVIFTAISVLALVSVTLGASAQMDAALHSRQKRNLGTMCHLMEIYTNRDCLDYNGYGCFCGIGGAGNTPVDDVDACCRAHDRCWDGFDDCSILPKQFVLYNVGCNGNSCTCTDDQNSSPCKFKTCQCDLDFAKCLGWSVYNSRYSDYDRDQCK